MLRKNSEHTNSSRSINSWCRGARGLHFVNIYGLKPETKNNKRRTVCGSLVAVKPEGHFVRDVLLETSAGSPPAWQLLGTAAEGAVVGEEDRSWRLCRLLRCPYSSRGQRSSRKKSSVRGCAGRAMRGKYMRNSAESKLSGSSRLPTCKVSSRRDRPCKVSPEPAPGGGKPDRHGRDLMFPSTSLTGFASGGLIPAGSPPPPPNGATASPPLQNVLSEGGVQAVR
jgi:hypothetical protein